MTTDQSAEDARRARHLVGNVQRFGLFSAAAVVGRYTAMVDRVMVDDRPWPAPRSLDGLDPGSLVDRAARLAEAYLRFLETTAVIASRAGRGEARPEMETIVLPPARPAGTSETSLWVHNPTSSASTGIEVAATGLISPEGMTIPAQAVWTSPQKVVHLDPSTSTELRLRVDVPRDQPPGLYFGLVLIAEAPDDPISLLLKVEKVDGAGL
ncbi:MAG: hypothetical protein ACRDZM_04070 [Acidimicrobiia bacterium]